MGAANGSGMIVRNPSQQVPMVIFNASAAGAAERSSENRRAAPG
jgi:hypothetical protein